MDVVSPLSVHPSLPYADQHTQQAHPTEIWPSSNYSPFYFHHLHPYSNFCLLQQNRHSVNLRLHRPQTHFRILQGSRRLCSGSSAFRDSSERPFLSLISRFSQGRNGTLFWGNGLDARLSSIERICAGRSFLSAWCLEGCSQSLVTLWTAWTELWAPAGPRSSSLSCSWIAFEEPWLVLVALEALGSRALHPPILARIRVGG